MQDGVPSLLLDFIVQNRRKKVCLFSYSIVLLRIMQEGVPSLLLYCIAKNKCKNVCLLFCQIV